VVNSTRNAVITARLPNGKIARETLVINKAQ
jgi:hypothetical protein